MAGHPILAALYDRMFARVERDGLAEMRGDLIGGAQGRTLELGAGTGLNLSHYGAAVTSLVLAEPDPHMAKRLRGKLAADQPAPESVEVIETGAEQLPFENASFDTVVGTLVFCTIADPAGAIAEVGRVLRPGGRFLFLEHVRGPDGTRLARWQDRLERPWGWVAGGCHPNRDTERLLAGSGLQIDVLERGELPRSAGPMVRPIVRGRALR